MNKFKKFISLLLVATMIVTFCPNVSIGQSVEVKAATSGITNGATYTIVSAYNGKDCLAYQHRDTTSMTMPQTRLTYSLPALYCTACTSARRNVFPKRAVGNSTHSAVNTSGKSSP